MIMFVILYFRIAIWLVEDRASLQSTPDDSDKSGTISSRTAISLIPESKEAIQPNNNTSSSGNVIKMVQRLMHEWAGGAGLLPTRLADVLAQGLVAQIDENLKAVATFERQGKFLLQIDAFFHTCF